MSLPHFRVIEHRLNIQTSMAIWVIGNLKLTIRSNGENHPHGFEVPHKKATHYLINSCQLPHHNFLARALLLLL